MLTPTQRIERVFQNLFSMLIIVTSQVHPFSCDVMNMLNSKD